MQKALERQLDAYDIDIDTEEGWVRFSLYGSGEINFHQIADVLDSAGYELTAIAMKASGKIVRDAQAAWLVLTPTGQRIPLDGNPTAAAAGEVQGVVVGLEGTDARLRLGDTASTPQ